MIGDTVFHVTLNPQSQVYEKCRENISDGYKVYLLVPQKKLANTLKSARDSSIEYSITIQSIEAFIGQNIDELAQFSSEGTERKLRELFEVYNERSTVDRVAPQFITKEEIETKTIKSDR